jgi:hypothetical protein
MKRFKDSNDLYNIEAHRVNIHMSVVILECMQHLMMIFQQSGFLNLQTFLSFRYQVSFILRRRIPLDLALVADEHEFQTHIVS